MNNQNLDEINAAIDKCQVECDTENLALLYLLRESVKDSISGQVYTPEQVKAKLAELRLKLSKEDACSMAESLNKPASINQKFIDTAKKHKELIK